MVNFHSLRRGYPIYPYVIVKNQHQKDQIPSGETLNFQGATRFIKSASIVEDHSETEGTIWRRRKVLRRAELGT